ncbi:hypothetical protein FMO001_07250 [Moritella sp. F1]|nr:hypothetical protein FMO001_07250 [Moritella sp. F1]
MQELQKPVHYKHLTKTILTRGLCTTAGKTPELTINAIITKSINKEGVSSPFLKVEAGTYKLKNALGFIELHPDEVEPSFHKEGMVKQVLVNVYERNSNARDDSILHHGIQCYVCSFDFADFYGSELGKGFIHVHHVYDISLINDEYQVDPIKDLIPLCPNCHAMVHRHRPAMHPDKLKKEVFKNKKEAKSSL